MSRYRYLHSLLMIFVLTALFALSYASQPSRQLKYQYQITGLKDKLLTNVNARLAIEQRALQKPLSIDEVHLLYKRSPQIIQKALQPYGYFKSTVHAQLTHVGHNYIAKFDIKLGPPIKISVIHLIITGEGKDNKKLQSYQHNLPLHSGQIFDALAYEKLKNELLLLANDEGFIKANYPESKVVIDLEKYTVKILLHLDTRKRYYFGKVNFQQNAYDERFLKRFVAGKSDAPFSSNKLNTLQQNLVGSYYFQEATVTPDFEHIEDYHVPINVNLVPPKAKRYTIGVGYGTLTGPRLSASMALRRLNSRGHHFETQIKLSQVISGFAAKYYIPGKNPLTDDWMFSAGYQKFSPQNGMSYSKTLSFGYNSKWHHFRNNLSLNYLIENFKVTNETDTTTTSKLLYPKLNIYYVKADDLINPHEGGAVDFMLQGASSNLLSSVSFLQTEIKGKYIFALSNYNRFILRGDLGYSIVKNLDDLPLTMRFFAGGLNTLRGFKDSSVGPGRYLKAASIEFQQRIYDKWNGAIFYDAATASDHFNSAFKKSQGIGIIYESVIGPAKVYVARAPGNGKKTYSLEFSIGPEF